MKRKKITNTYARTAALGSTTQDSLQPGLRLVVSPNGLRSWYAYFWAPPLGKAIKQVIGHAPSISVEAARAEIDRVRNKMPKRPSHISSLRVKWTEDVLRTEALRYKSRGELLKHSRGAYEAAREQGLLDAICAHMQDQRFKGQSGPRLRQVNK